MKRVHSPMTIHRPSLVSRKAKARGVYRLRHRDEFKYKPPAPHWAFAAALPMASSLLTAKPDAQAGDQVAGVRAEGVDDFEISDLIPIGIGVGALGFVIGSLYLINTLAKHQAMRAMMDRSIDRFPQINANVVIALQSHRIQNSISKDLAPEVSDPSSWPLPGLSQGFVKLAKDLSDIIDADMNSDDLLGRVGPTVLLSDYGMSEFQAGRMRRMQYTAQLLYGESEGFTTDQRKNLNEIFFGTPVGSLGRNIDSSIMILKKATAEHEVVSRHKKLRQEADEGRHERKLGQGVHHIAAAMIWRRRAQMLDTQDMMTTDLANARGNLDEAQRLFDEVRGDHPEWFNRSYSNLGRLVERVGTLKKAVQFDMLTSNSPPPAAPINPGGRRGPRSYGGPPDLPPAACTRLGALWTMNLTPQLIPSSARLLRV